MPRLKKATVLKMVQGTTRADRPDTPAVEAEPLTEIPEPVDWLINAHAVKMWRRVAPLLVANKVLALSDLEAFGHLCSLHGKMVQVWLSGEAPIASLIAGYNALAGAFGLAAGWRSRIKPIGDKDPANKWEKLKPKTR